MFHIPSDILEKVQSITDASTKESNISKSKIKDYFFQNYECGVE